MTLPLYSAAHYRRCIIEAQNSGFHYYAAALYQLYLMDYKEGAK